MITGKEISLNFNNFPKFQLPKLQLPRLELPEWIAPKKDLPPLVIGDLRAAVPVVQGGMGVGISLAGLAAAVAEAGGVGVIAANAIGMIEPDYYADGRAADQRALRSEIRRARARTRGVIGVNLMVAVNDFHELLQVVVEERADIVFLGAGLPLRGIPVAALRAANVKVAPIVSSGRAARLIFTHWRKSYGDVPDAVVVEGPLAGGHLGFKPEQIDDPAYALERIVPDVMAFLRSSGLAIPAGGANVAGSLLVKVPTGRAADLLAAGARVSTGSSVLDGAFGVFYPGLTLSESANGTTWVHGLQQDAKTRSNVALVNYGDAGNVTLRLTYYGANGQVLGNSEEHALAPGAWLQKNEPLLSRGASAGSVKVERISGTSRFVAYGVLNDAATSDGSYLPMAR